LWGHASHIARDRLENNSSDFASLLFKGSTQSIDVIKGDYYRISGEIGWDAGTVGCSKGRQSRTGFHEEAVAVSVVATFALYDSISSCEAAREPNCAHRCFRTRAGQPDAFNRRECRHYFIRKLNLQFGRRAVAGSSTGGFSNRFDNCRMRVSHYHRPPGAYIIDIAVSVYIRESGAGSIAYEQRRAANRAKRTNRTVNTARDD